MAKALKSYHEHSGGHGVHNPGSGRTMTAAGPMRLQGLQGRAAYCLLRERQRAKSAMSTRINGYRNGMFTSRTASRTDIHPLRHSHSGVIRIPTGLEKPSVVGEIKVQSHRQVQSARSYRPAPAARPNSPSCMVAQTNSPRMVPQPNGPCMVPKNSTTVGQYSDPKVDPINLVTLANSHNSSR